MKTPTQADQGTPSSASDGAAPDRAAQLAPLSLREVDRAALRPIVADIESHLTTLQVQSDMGGYADASATLVSRWRRLVELMALGTAPELRVCPHCGYHINATATRCIQCWKHSAAQPRP